MKQTLIAGIDPGTTTAIALIDINKNVIKLCSRKDFDLNNLILFTLKFGNVICVGCDKKNVPSFAEKFRIKIGARIFHPKNDLLITEKKELVGNFKTNNSHEMDALASAFFAFRQIDPLIKKTDLFIQKKDKPELKDELIRIMIKNPMINLSVAYDIIENPEAGAVKLITKVAEEKELTKYDLRLYAKLKNFERENMLLREYQEKIKNDLAQKNMGLRNHLHEKPILNKKLGQLLRFKEKRIKALFQDIKELEEKIQEQKKEIESLNNLISNFNSKIIAKILKNFSWNEYQEKNKKLNITKGDILFIKEPAIYSENTIAELRKKIKIIILDKEYNKSLLKGFLIILLKDLEYEQYEFFISIPLESYEKAISEKDIFYKVLEEYKKTRKENIDVQ